MALLSFDDAWRQSCDRVQQLLPCGETYSEALFACRKTLWEVMGKVGLYGDWDVLGVFSYSSLIIC